MEYLCNGSHWPNSWPPYFQMLCCSNHTLRRPSPQSISSSPLSPHVLVQKMNSWANQTLPFPSCSKLVYITATGVIDSHPHNVLSSAALLLFCSPAAVVTICSRENQWPKRGSRDRELAFLERKGSEWLTWSIGHFSLNQQNNRTEAEYWEKWARK